MRGNKGFTLIELIVSFSIFIVLITLTTATFAQTLKTQRIVGSLSVAMNEVSFVTEQMAREIRTGTKFKNIDSEGKTIQFINANDEQVVYRYKEIDKRNKRIERCFLPSGTEGECSNYEALTSPEVEIDTLKFVIKLRDERGNKIAPRITIVTAVAGPNDINVNLQTTISARVIEGGS